MCGIAGIFSADPETRGRIGAMTQALYHRGPDGEGFFDDDKVALGHRRLAIVDLGGGAQPMSNESGRLRLVCNGEIYNSPELRRRLEAKGHVFKTHCDVEVILHLYEEHGPDCVKHLRGMFAFALWDPDTGTLLLARDPMGQKPLHFVERDGELYFASEIRAFLDSGLVRPEIDLDGVWHYVSLRFLPERLTMFEGVRKLPAGHRLVFKDGRAVIDKYWEIDFLDKVSWDEEEAVERLDSFLLDTVDLHRLSDVRVGTFLSGGIDSGTISAMVQKQTDEPVPAFSIGVFEDSYNELPWAKMVTDQWNMEPHVRRVEADILDNLPQMIRAMAEPADPFGVGVYLASKLASEHVKCVMGGDGGDENFAGYDRFAGQKMLEYYCMVPEFMRRHIVQRLINLIPNSFDYKSVAQKAQWLNHMSFFDRAGRYAESMQFLRFHKAAKEQLFTQSAQGRVCDPDSAQKILDFYNMDNCDELIDRMLFSELRTRVPDHNLMINDRMSMAHSLEVRSPLIDHELVQFAAHLPTSLKLKGTKIKYVLRRVAERYLSKELVYRQKQGFGFPLGKWMRGDLRGFVQNLLGQSRFVEMGLFERGFVEQLRAEHNEGTFEHSYRLWILVNLELWHDLHFENRTAEQTQERILALSAA